MNCSHRRFVPLLLVAASALAAEDPASYRPLFDGQSLAGWEGAGQPAEKCWKVDEGQIVCTGEKGPWLRSTEQFDDFNLRLEYKLKPGGNSGVYIRVPENGTHHGDGAGIEVQVLDDAAERYRMLKPYQYTGSLYAIAPATSHVAKPAGEWNTLEINCRGTKYHVVHNGTTIIAADETTFPELKGRLTKGHLGLQNHSEEVWYRNLRIGPALDLPIPAAPSLDKQ
jgi:3-keto-disaccharide hydrolase